MRRGDKTTSVVTQNDFFAHFDLWSGRARYHLALSEQFACIGVRYVATVSSLIQVNDPFSVVKWQGQLVPESVYSWVLRFVPVGVTAE